MSRAGRFVAAGGGVLGPALFTWAWWRVGAGVEGYSAKAQPISRLAARRVRSRPAMTAGFVAYAAGVGRFAPVLGRHSRPAGGLAALNALSMLAIAALPLDAPYGDGPHVVAATAGYATLALTPLVAGRGRDAVPTAIGIGTGALLAASQLRPASRGMWQRLGLGLGHSWIVASAIRSLRR